MSTVALAESMAVFNQMAVFPNGCSMENVKFIYMKTPEDFEPVCDSFTDDDSKERLVWVDEKSEIIYYSTFFRNELMNPSNTIKHIVTDNRK